jgi:hypothetical protein
VEVLVVVLVAAVALGLMMWGAIWGLNTAAVRMVGDRHRLLQGIVETGEVPAAWRRRYEGRLARLERVPALASRAASLHRQAQEDYLKRLDRLAGYVETSTLVDGEQTRRALLNKLASVRASWQAVTQTALDDGEEP